MFAHPYAILITILAFLVALGILITFHELGHYLAARHCGVRVLRFSLGFGKPLWMRKDRHGTEWAVAAIPLGGYVKMLDDAADEEAMALLAQDGVHNVSPEEAFKSKSVWNRFYIVAAGPMANFLLAGLIYMGLGMYGSQEPQAVLAQPPEQTPAAAAHLTRGDHIVAVDGSAVESWPQMAWALMPAVMDGDQVSLTVESSSGLNTRMVDFSSVAAVVRQSPEQDPLGLAGLKPGGDVLFGTVMADSAAEAAGLLDGDQLVAVDDLFQPDVTTFIQYVQGSAGVPLTLQVLRDGAQLTFEVIPHAVIDEDGREIGRIGVGIGSTLPVVTVRHGFLDSLWQAAERTVGTAWFSVKMLGKMIVGEISLRNLSGPVTIADHAGKSAQMGLVVYLNFVALVSISIGVLNLLPIPMLDGGHLAFYTLEIARGKPVPERWMDLGYRAGAAVLAGLMVLALLNDFTRLLN